MIEIKNIKLKDIKAYENNPRKNDKAVGVVAKSIEEFGFLVPVILDENSVIVAGHTRVSAAHKLGMTEVPAIYASGLSQKQIDAFRIMDNKSQEYAKWDVSLLEIELRALQQVNYDLSNTGMTEAEIDRILNPKEEIPKAGTEPKYKVELGDVYILGKHRLICGDSTKPQTYEKLMNGDKADMVFTDPPYGVSYSGLNNPNGKDWDVIDGDDLRGDELYNMLYLAFENIHAHTTDNPAVYVFHASSNQIIFEKALNKNGFGVKQQLIWNKHHVLGHSHYHWTHEPMFYASKDGKTPHFYGDRCNKTILNELDIESMDAKELRKVLKQIDKTSTIWKIKKDNAMDYIHPTQKQTGIAEKAMINSSKAGQIVLEPFAGSGSTLLAAEKRQRRCFAVELDPVFCSHIIERYEEMTGEKHIKE